MSKKTKAVDYPVGNPGEAAQQGAAANEHQTEQAPRDVALDAKICRVDFSPVERLEKLARSGFCCERLESKDLSVPLFRLCVEILQEDAEHEIEDLPQPVTPFMTADQLADVIQGATLLHPMIVSVVQKRHPEGVQQVINEENPK